MPLLTWDPLRGLVVLERELDDPVPDASGWTPPIDIVETETAFIITAELAGVPVEAVNVSVHGGRVTLRGARPARAVNPEQYHRVERGHGHFSRTFTLPQSVDVNDIHAEASDGVLVVTLPKLRRPEPRRVSVK